MSVHTLCLFSAVFLQIVIGDEITSNALDGYNTPYEIVTADWELITSKFLEPRSNEKVKVQLYYECLCPDCINFDTSTFVKTVLKLRPYLDVYTYPYGNARTIENNGTIMFLCQHGEQECYGNKLHACALDKLNNITAAVVFNSCLMKYGSNDKAVDQCGRIYGVHPGFLKTCARGSRGTQLLKYYGEESKKANFKYVPYILINGVENNGTDFESAICQQLTNPPVECLNFYIDNRI